MELQTMSLRFRVWDKQKHKIVATDLSIAQLVDFLHRDWQQGGWGEEFTYPQYEISQDTGLKDKNGLHNVYGGDIIDADGKIIGDLWQNEPLLQDTTNLLITEMGTSSWTTTEQEAIRRGCHYARVI